MKSGCYKLIDNDVQQHKAELHTHTTCSDGKYTPTESKALYQTKFFSVVAYTDHDVFVRHHEELSDESFIALNGFELGVPSVCEDELGREKQVHLNFLATSPEIKEMPFYNPKYIYQKGAKAFIGKVPYDGDLEDREHSVEWLNCAIQKGNEQGFLVTYNHPIWSVVEPKDYLPLDGLFAMEVWNTGSLNDMPEDGAAWREMVWQGKDVKCVAANDFHAEKPYYDAMQAATYICTDDFSYQGIITALKEGKFYSSTGPQIQEIRIEDGKICIECSPVKSIRLVGATAYLSKKIAEPSEYVTSAEFPLLAYHKNMFYVQLDDGKGGQAWSNAFFNVGAQMLAAQMQQSSKTLFLHDKMVEYPFLEKIDGLAHTYFYKQYVTEQIDEIVYYCNQYDFQKVYVQFSSSEIIGYDYIFDKGVEEIKRMQAERLQTIEKKLNELVVYAHAKSVELVFLSMLSLPHGANVYDYRNNFARVVSETEKRIAEKNGYRYIHVSTPLENEKGILAEEYQAKATCLVEKFFMENSI